MGFYEVLDQVVALLRQRGRVTYRALKREFQLDDAFLEDLKDELIKAQHLAVDEQGDVLVWTGGAGIPPVPGALALSPTPQGEPSEPHMAALTASPVLRQSSEAERRQLTVMFCDLVDSTALSAQLDPEDLREVIRAYQATCAEVIQRFEGYIAQYLGDGLLIYFGYPQAHEDDARRAVQAGLGMVEAMRGLNAHLAPRHGMRLAVRIGIHTGVVVVGEVGSGSRQEQLALGDTPNVAARVQGLAAPDTVVVSAATFRLIQGYFTSQELGHHTLKGVAMPIHMYQVVGESGMQSRLDASIPTGLTPLVGREEEVALLYRRWEQATGGARQVVLLSGEAGIGKSRLVQVLKEHIVHEPHVRVEWRGSAYHQQSALYPVIDHLHRLLRWHQDDPPHEKLQKLEGALRPSGLARPDVVALIAALLSLPLPAHSPPLTMTPQRQRQHTLDTLVMWLCAEARRQPVLLMVEDLHWIDPSTLELLSVLIDQGASARLCLVLTHRPEFHPPWAMVAHLTPLTLRRFAPAQVERLATSVAGDKQLPVVVLQEMVRRADGIPLFVEELTKTVLESGLLRAQADHYELPGPLPPLAIPATLHDALMARLDRLATSKVVAQLGATIGRTFAYDVMQAVAPLDVATLQGALTQLVEADLVVQRGIPPQATYTFKHALIQDAAYQSLLRSTRQQYHQHIAHVLEERFAEVGETQPELLAHHYTEAGLHEQAIPYWQRAGQRTLARLAYTEALHHLTTGLTVLATVPETPARHQHELALLTALIEASQVTKGEAAPEIAPLLTRAVALAQQVGEPSQRFKVLYLLWRFHNVRLESQAAYAVAEQLLDLAQRQHAVPLLLRAYHALGVTSANVGALASARTHHEQGIALCDSQEHATPHALPEAIRYYRVFFRALVAGPLWLLGYPDQAVRRMQEALTMAQASAHPLSLRDAHRFSARLHARRREWQTVQAHAEALLAVATEHGFARYVALGAFLRGWALAAQGQHVEGITQMRQSLDAWWTDDVLARLAEAYGQVGQVDEGLHLLAEALAIVDKKGSQEEAELHRLYGELLLLQSIPDEPAAEACFQRALTVARHQQAKSYELRVAQSLACLWQHQGKRAEAYELLAPVYGWFTEGFDTADLQEAKTLLAELS